jgi:hypothetical protein
LQLQPVLKQEAQHNENGVYKPRLLPNPYVKSFCNKLSDGISMRLEKEKKKKKSIN